MFLKYDALLFRDVTLTPEQQYALVKVSSMAIQLHPKIDLVRQAFDPDSEVSVAICTKHSLRGPTNALNTHSYTLTGTARRTKTKNRFCAFT
jgi:hypothetical protein